MNTPLTQQLALATFTPSSMSQAVLEGMFVQREQLLKSIVQDLAASVDGKKEYLMLVGARGMGKTHFVSLVYHRLKQNPDLKNRLLIAWLREEEYGVNSWLYLIIEILRSISQEGIETTEQINKLSGLPIHEAEYLANRVLTEVIGDRTLLIVTENIDKLLYGLGDKEQWKFRSFLQETNCCSILATTPKISEDTSKKDKPFFGFFTTIHLPTFSHTDAVAMLIKIANLSGNIQLAKFLNTDEGKSRVRALHHLAGGNPRVYALFAQLITEDTLEALLPAVIDMLDKLTPYYQSRVESLGQSDDQQKIVMYLARETRAVTVKEITAQCFISSERTTSNALKKLKDKGYVIFTQRGREVYYEISEVLMRLCLEMKNARNGDLKLCVDFLRIWYRPKERQEYLEQLEADGKLEHAKYFRMSLVDAKFDPILLACQKDLYKSFDDGDTDTALTVWRELVSVNVISESKNRRITELIDIGVFAEAITLIDELLNRETAKNLYQKGLLLCESEQWEKALEAFDRALEKNPVYDDALYNRGIVLGILGRYDKALDSLDRSLQLQPDNDNTWFNKGNTLGNIHKYEEALDSFDRAIQIKPEHDEAWRNRGAVLYQLGRYEDAIDSSNYALLINPDGNGAWFLNGVALYQLCRYEEALDRFERVIQIGSDDTIWYQQSWHNKGKALYKLGKHLESINAFQQAINIDPDNYKYLYSLGYVLFHVSQYDEALTSWQKTFSIIQTEEFDTSDLIQEFLDEQLLLRFQQPAVRDILPQLITIYTTAQVLPELGVALTRNLKAIQSPTISDYTAAEWLKMWQELGKPHPELALALRMLEAGIKYKHNPKDDRVFLSLPQEMRPLLKEALGLEP